MLKWLLFITLFLSGLVMPCRAQYQIPLDRVEKITFINSTPFWAGQNYNRIEILPEQGEWKIYQLERHAYQKDELDRKFLRPILKKDISQLLKLIGQADTVIRPELFKIDKNRILSQFDTLLPFLKPRNRDMISKKISSKKFLNDMIIDQLHRGEDDRNSYVISIKTKGGLNYKVSAYANPQIYGHLPWTIGNAVSYDPRISAIFDGIVADSFESYSVKRFYSQMVFWAFMKYFRTNLAMDDLKNDFPIAYKSLINTFKPVTVGDNNGIYNLRARRPIDSMVYYGSFQTARLPKYLNLSFGFNPSDTNNIYFKKKYVDTLGRFFDGTATLFDQLKSIPEAKIGIDQYFMKQHGDHIFKSLEKNFPGIRKYDYRQTHLLYLTGTDGIKSVWFLLPDNTLILCKYLYRGGKPKKDDAHFMGLDDDTIRRHLDKSHAVCIHVNAAGKLIRDYGELEHLDLTRSF